MTDVSDIVRLGGQHQEIVKRIVNGSLDTAIVREAYQQIIEGKFNPTDRFARYKPLLLPLQYQWNKICYYNARYWGNYFSEQELRAYQPKLGADRQQLVEDLEMLHVEFGSREETIEMWWKVFQGEQPEHWRWEPLKLDSKHYKLLPSNVATYPAKTITKVRINLISYWEPEKGRTLEEVRTQAEAKGEILAQAEVMSMWGLHTELFREQDGDNLPRTDMAGTDVSVPGESLPYALYVSWYPGNQGAGLRAGWVGSRLRGWSAPVILPRS